LDLQWLAQMPPPPSHWACAFAPPWTMINAPAATPSISGLRNMSSSWFQAFTVPIKLMSGPEVGVGAMLRPITAMGGAAFAAHEKPLTRRA
jgi:hypothetical protein